MSMYNNNWLPKYTLLLLSHKLCVVEIWSFKCSMVIQVLNSNSLILIYEKRAVINTSRKIVKINLILFSKQDIMWKMNNIAIRMLAVPERDPKSATSYLSNSQTASALKIMSIVINSCQITDNYAVYHAKNGRSNF